MNILEGICNADRIDIDGFANVEGGLHIVVTADLTNVVLETSSIKHTAKFTMIENLKKLIEQLEE